MTRSPLDGLDPSGLGDESENSAALGEVGSATLPKIAVNPELASGAGAAGGVTGAAGAGLGGFTASMMSVGLSATSGTP